MNNDLDENNLKDTNTTKFRRNSLKIKKGRRSHSPEYRLSGKIEKRYYNKLDTSKDYPINDCTTVKLQIKKKDKNFN